VRLILLLLLLDCSSLWAHSFKNTHLINGCALTSWEGKREKVFPGVFCQFFDNGSFLSASHAALRFIDKDRSVKWEYKAHFHHQLNLSNDKERILAMSSDWIEKEGKELRVDRLIVFALDGKVLMSESSDKITKQELKQNFSHSELTHFNSFYEIPEIKAPAPFYIKKGNFVVNSNQLGVYILSSDLKTVLHHQKISTSQNHQIHDVQILPNGHMIYFNNVHALSTKELRHSSIEELDLNKNKIIFEFKSNPVQAFFSWYCGGVQKLDEDTVLFSHLLTGTYLYSIKKNKILDYSIETHVINKDKFYPTQQVKAQNLNAFLTHWK
jgi:hypothetical protein